MVDLVSPIAPIISLFVYSFLLVASTAFILIMVMQAIMVIPELIAGQS